MKKKYKTTIDKFGRIVIPKEIRNDFGLSKDVELYIEEETNGILLHPRLKGQFIVNKDGVLVIRAELTESIEGFLEKSRQSRIKYILKDM